MDAGIKVGNDSEVPREVGEQLVKIIKACFDARFDREMVEAVFEAFSRSTSINASISNCVVNGDGKKV